MSEVLEVEQRANGVRVLRMNRPGSLNALNGELVQQLNAQLDAAGNDPLCSVLLLTGNGRGFSAGLDIPSFDLDEVRSGPAVALDMQHRYSALIRKLHALPVPTIAAVNGIAFGGGLALATACDMRIASLEATLAAGFARLGLGGSELGLTWLLPRMIGRGHAIDICVSGRAITCTEALAMGLVDRAVPGDELARTADCVAEAMAANGRTVATVTKASLRLQLEIASLEAGIEFDDRTQALLSSSPDLVGYLTSFNDRPAGA